MPTDLYISHYRTVRAARFTTAATDDGLTIPPSPRESLCAAILAADPADLDYGQPVTPRTRARLVIVAMLMLAAFAGVAGAVLVKIGGG